YWHRAAFITLMSIFNSLRSRADERRFGGEIHRVAIEEPPLFILGHWRTGTTFLHNLLGHDSRFAYPNLYEVMHPGSFLSNEDAHAGIWASRAVPAKRPMDNVTLAVDAPQEDEFALALSCLRSPDIALNFPRSGAPYRRYLTFEGVPAEE